MGVKCDFSGWATKNDLKCSDGRTIKKDAFKGCDGKVVPLVWNHSHNDPQNVLGHALLENRNEGVYTYCEFNNTENGRAAKESVKHGDVVALSIYANQLKQMGADVIHGAIREVSLVLAGANPGAMIDTVICHSDDVDEEAYIFTGEEISISHSMFEEDDNDEGEEIENENEEENDDSETVEDEDLSHAEKESQSEEESDDKSSDDETIEDVYNTLSDKQKKVVNVLIGGVIQSAIEDMKDDEDGGKEDMKHNVFEKDSHNEANVLSHADQQAIISLAKTTGVGSLQDAISIYAEQNESLAHGIDDIEQLFPDYKDVRPGAPEMITRDQTWVGKVMAGVHKSPISRIRTRQADLRPEEIRANGYKKGSKKVAPPNFKLLKRTTDPQTVYRKDALHRDDIIDITEFDVVEYQYGIMKMNLNEEIAQAIMIGDGRDDASEYKISEEHIRPIWTDDELYTIHVDVDIAAAKAELQGTNTSANFGANYIYAEAIITAALYSREQYKGTGTPDFYCTPHLLNVMLLARDLNGRRIYDSKADLAAALNVDEIVTVEQFEGKVRTTKDGAKKKLLGLFVNLVDYQVGSTKGGEITRFNQFDIDFNQEKYLIETRLSGALTRIFSAIALEEPVVAANSQPSQPSQTPENDNIAG